MNDITVIQIISLVGFLILAASAFASYRMSWGKTLQLALVWFAIFAGLFVIASLMGATLPT